MNKNMSNVMIQSTAIRDDYMTTIVDKTIKEIHDDIVTVFGPYAQDAFIYKDGSTYFTRDGKEVISSMRFSNPLSMYILKVLCQAVFDQAKAVGDGTTTLAVLYTNLYTAIKEYIKICPRITRSVWSESIDILINVLNRKATTMTDEDMKSMFLTCTQDIELAAKLYNNLKDPLLDGAFITLEKSNIESDFVMDIHNSPVIKSTLQYSVRPFGAKETNCVILHCNGVLDIAHYEVVLDMMSSVATYGEGNNAVPVPRTIIILCNGLSAATRQMTKELNKFLNTRKISVDQYNNIVFMTLDEYRGYSAEQIEDISTIITDEIGIGGLVNQLTFESMLHQAIGNPKQPIEELCTFDCDVRHLQKIRDMIFQEPFTVEYDAIRGIRIHKPLGPVAHARYDELKKQIQEEKSEVVKIGLKRRLKTMYGQFIDIQVGSKLLKDSQRKYELILDAVVSASEAVEKGVLRQNSILTVVDTISVMLKTCEFTNIVHRNVINIVYTAMLRTVRDMMSNRFELIADWSDDDIVEMLTGVDITRFDMNRTNITDVLPKVEDDKVATSTYSVTDDDGNVTSISGQIVEPISIITRMLENTTLILDLAQAKSFHVDQFMENYI